MSAILQDANRPVEWAAGLISLDESPIVMAQFDRFSRWNGFLCPSMDALTCVRVIEEINQSYGSDVVDYGYVLDWAGDALILTSNQYKIEEGDDYEPEIIEADEDGLYSLGAYGWVWSEWSEYAGDLEVGERFTVNGEEWLTCVALSGDVVEARSADALVTLDQDDVVCTVTYAKGLVSA